jgi:hypothetical protein
MLQPKLKAASMAQPKSNTNQGSAGPGRRRISSSDVFPRPLAPKKHLAELSRRSDVLRIRSESLRTEFDCVTDRLESLQRQLNSARPAVQKSSRQDRIRRQESAPAEPLAADVRRLTPTLRASVAQALSSAVEILRCEFTGTNGSGNDTLRLCEQALDSVFSRKRWIELPLD